VADYGNKRVVVFPQPNGAKHVWFGAKDSKRWCFVEGGPDLIGNTEGNPVYLCEGEWDAMRMADEGLCAATTTGGAGEFKEEWAKRLRKKDVIVLYDHDEAGRRGGQNAARVLSKEAATVRVVQWQNLEDREDVSDYLARYSLRDLLKIVAETPPFEGKPSKKKKKKKKEEEEIVLPCIDQDGVLYEMCYSKERTPPVWYLASDSPQKEKFELRLASGLIARPPIDDTVLKGAIKLPDAAWAVENEARLVEGIGQYLDKYIVMKEEHRELSIYYVLLTWLYDRFEVVPYLHIYGDTGSGKTNCMMKICAICYRGIIMGSVRAAVLYRTVDKYRGTLGMDEQNWEGRPDEESGRIMDVLLNGYKRGLAVYVTDISRKDMPPKGFECYGPKILVSIKPFRKEALRNRCIGLDMSGSYMLDEERAKQDHTEAEVEGDARPLRNMLLWWRMHKYYETKYCADPFPLVLEPRTREIFSPLFSVTTDPQVRERMGEMAKRLNQETIDERGLTSEAEVIGALVERITEFGDRQWVKLQTLLSVINDPSRHIEFSPQGLGRILNRWGLQRRRKDGMVEYCLDAVTLMPIGRKFGIE